MLTEGHTFEVWVGDEMRASTWAMDREEALGEARHYEWTYRDEPDVRVYEVTRRLVPPAEEQR